MRRFLPLLALAVVAAALLLLFRGDLRTAENVVPDVADSAAAPLAAPAGVVGANTEPSELAAIEGAAERSEADALAAGDAEETEVTFPMARLFGRVLDEEQRPVAGLEVDLISTSVWREGVVVPTVERNGRTRSLWRAETAADGSFTLDVPVPTADWVMLIVEGDPYSGLVDRDFGHAGGRNKPPIVEGDNDLGVIVVPQTGALTGVVHDVNGVPIEGAIVTLDGSFPGGRVVNTRTDALGRYELGHVPPGPTTIEARHERFLLESRPGPTVVARQTVDGPSFLLAHAPAIGGLVVDEGGEPLPGIRVWGWPTGSGRGAGGTTDDAGRFVIYLPQHEPYILEANRDTRFVPWGGRSAPGSTYSPGAMDIRVELVRASRLEVHVVDAESGDPIERFSVDVEGAGSSGGAPMGDHSGGVVDVPASPGDHTLIVKSPGYVAATVEVAFDRAPAGGETGAQTVQMARGASVTGRVTLDGQPVPAAQVTFGPQPLPNDPGTPIAAEDWTGETWHFDVDGEAARERDLGTGADGEFQIEGAATGTYRLTAKGAGGSPKLVENIVVKDQVDVALGDVELVPEATLIGEIRLAGDVSAVGLEVDLDFPSRGEAAVESADGTFILRGLEPGEIGLQIEADGHRILRPVRRKFTILAGETKHLLIDLTDQAVFDFTVRVRSGGAPLSGVDVTLDGVHEYEGTSYLSEGLRIGPTGDDGLARGPVTAGRPLVAVVRDGPFEVGRSAIVVPGPGRLEEALIDVSFGALVLELPSGFELPDAGKLEVRLRPMDLDPDWRVDPFSGRGAFLTKGAGSSEGGRPWIGVSHDVGRVAPGRYALSVSVLAREGRVFSPMLEPHSQTVEILAGKTTQVQLSR